MAGTIDVGGIHADLQLDSGHMERGLANARKAMDAFERELKTLDDEVMRGSISVQDWGTRVAVVRDEMNKLGAAMHLANSAVSQTTGALGVMNAGMSKATSGTGALARGLMQVGYAVDDIQYGFAGVVNNISPLVYSFSAAAGASTAMASGIAAGAQLATVAAYQLYVHWDDVQDLFGVGATRTEAEEMEDLAKATKLTADEQKRLNDYKKEQKELEKLRETPNKATREDEKSKEGAIKDIGFNELKVGLMKGFVGDGTNAKISPEDQAELDAANDYAERGKKVNREIYQDRINKRDELQERINKKLSDEDSKQAEKLLLRAMNDNEGPDSKNPGAMSALKNRVMLNESLFPEGTLEKLMKTSPEERQKAKDEKKAKKDAKDLSDQIDSQYAAFDASTAEWKKYKARRDKWVKEQVDALKGGELGQAAIAGTLTEDQTKDRLLKMGLDKDKVESAYEDVHRGLEISAGKTIAGRVAETGEDRDTAAANLAREDQEKRRKENADLAAKAIPGLDKAIEQRLTVGTAMTGNGAGVAAGLTEQIRQLLINAGVDPKAAANQASAAVEEGGQRVNKKVAEEAMDEQEKSKQRKSVDVFDAGGLAAKLQASVGDSEAKKQTTALEKSLGYLATIAGQTGRTIKFTK
ncbi:hypothetical protein [Singulisphaera sp. PoT]|uniref:hypothetical protein n=1 Tax=Singulisphaera sp. PoT TaxID=3411797 RepID=UPI003BF4EE58